MPIYEYFCKSCGEKFSLLQRVSSTERDTDCPKCSSKDVKKLVSSFCCSSTASGLSSPGASHGFGGGG